MPNKILKTLLPLVVIAVGAGVARELIRTRPKAEHHEAAASALVVEVQAVRPRAATTTVSAMGTVVPERTVTLQAQVAGELVEESPDFEVGGRLERNQLVVRIDATDYELAVQQRRADVARAKFDIELEKGRRAVAHHEWELLGGSVKTSPEGRRLALRMPHKEMAEASLVAAKSALARAKLNVSRTRILAPFDAIVREKRATIGQLVGPGTPIATLVSSSRYLVRVSVPIDKLGWLAIPGLNAGPGGGATARIVQETGGAPSLRTGVVTRILGDLDPAGRMARVVVAVDHPLEIAAARGPRGGTERGGGIGGGESSGVTARQARLPLLLGSYVRVEIDGKQLQGVYRVPRLAMREGDTVWLADARDGLEIRRIDVLWRQKGSVLARGLRPGERLIVSRIPSPVPGMKLRPQDAAGRKLAAGAAAAEPKPAPNQEPAPSAGRGASAP